MTTLTKHLNILNESKSPIQTHSLAPAQAADHPSCCIRQNIEHTHVGQWLVKVASQCILNRPRPNQANAIHRMLCHLQCSPIISPLAHITDHLENVHNIGDVASKTNTLKTGSDRQKQQLTPLQSCCVVNSMLLTPNLQSPVNTLSRGSTRTLPQTIDTKSYVRLHAKHDGQPIKKDPK